MRNVKNLVVLFLVLLISGCGSKDEVKVLEESLENIKELKSGIIQIETSVTTNEYTSTSNITKKFDSNGNSYTKTINNFSESSISSAQYKIVENDYVYIYSNKNNQIWTYRILKQGDYIDKFSLVNIGNLIKNYNKLEEVDSDIDGHVKMEIQIDKDKMMEFLDENPEFILVNNLELEQDLVMYIYEKDGYITRFVMKFNDGQSNASCSITYTISNQNQIEPIVISNDIKDSAISENFILDYEGWLL